MQFVPPFVSDKRSGPHHVAAADHGHPEGGEAVAVKLPKTSQNHFVFIERLFLLLKRVPRMFASLNNYHVY